MEYIIIVALIALSAIGVYSFFGKTIRNQVSGLAPDKLATYYVCFSDNVEIINGSPVTAKTLLTNQGDQAKWNIRVSANAGNIISNCIQSEVKPIPQIFGNIRQSVID